MCRVVFDSLKELLFFFSFLASVGLCLGPFREILAGTALLDDQGQVCSEGKGLR